MKYHQQLDESDCGAACLVMIADAYKSKINISTVREVAGTDKNGTNLNGMIIAGEKLGFEVKVLKGKRENLTHELPCPFIAHYKIKNDEEECSHYVVVKEVYKHKIIVYDPDPIRGKKAYSYDDFMKFWTGYCIFLYPSQNFSIQKDDRKGLLFKFLPLLKPYNKLLIQVCIISFILIFLGILGSFYFQYIIDEVIYSHSENTLFTLSLGVMIVTLFQIILESVRNYMLTVFSAKVDLQLIFSYFKHVLNLPVSFFDTRKTGEIISRLQDAGKIRDALTNATITLVMDSVMVFVIGITLFLRSRILFGIAILAVPFSSIIIWICSKPFAKQYRKMMGENAEVSSYLVEAINGGPTIKAMNASDQVFKRYEKKQIKALFTAFNLTVAQTIRNVFTSLINGWGNNLVFWIGSYFILKDQMSLGELISFNALLGYFLSPLQRLLNLQPNLQEAYIAAERLVDILELEEENSEGKQFIIPPKIYGNIEVKDVSFRYGTRRQILFDISLNIKAGTWVAFVGESGCGKSTFVKLLLKFYKPEQGDIILDGYNLQDIDTDTLRYKIGYVPQDIFLFSGTIAENISLHHSEATMEEIINAAIKAGANEFISNLPDRYNTIISERGTSLSGGERQRIALARALLGNPELLIFDEATSNLDNISENNIHETLKTLREDKITTILIAHRLTTVTHCDCIYVFDKGRIVESGTHKELLTKKGIYSNLWMSTK